MSVYKKSFLYVFLTAVLMLSIISSFCVAKASAQADIHGDETDVNVGEEVIIPVIIDNNSGIMGFKIILEYDSDLIEINRITSGTVTSSGMFDSNVGMKKGIIDVIWSNVKDVKEDGDIFKISLKALKEFNTSDIKISFSQPDTFNERWEDVVLKCEDINISCLNDSDDNPEKTKSDDTNSNGTKEDIKSDNDISDNSKTKEPSVTTESQLINAVDEALYDFGYDNINDIDDSDRFIQSVNEKIEEKTGEKDYYSDELGLIDIQKDYKENKKSAFKQDIKENLEQSKIDDAIDNSLKKVGKKSISEITEDGEKKQFVSALQDELAEAYPDVTNITDNLSDDDVVEIVGEIYDGGNKGNINTEGKKNRNIIEISIGGVLILLVTIVSVFIIRVKRKRKE